MTTLDRTSPEPAPPDRPPTPGSAAGPGEPARRNGLASEVEERTAAKLLSALGARLRAAYEQGAELDELAAASHQSLPAVTRLLEAAGVDLTLGRPLPARSTAPAAPGTVAAAGGRQLRRLRRPTPSRRLSRIHPPPYPSEDGAPAAGPGGPDGDPAVGADEQGRDAATVAPGAPLGILIGASPTHLEAAGQLGSRPPRRVPADLVRAGRGTSLVVLPSWRPAIVVSVPTERLLASTGLAFEQLSGARLSVVINPDALHDRELDLRDWQAEDRRSRSR
ncbi:hypothetical protein OG871_14285 [Kitasatospora sp. NBC_00374]|uniref:hypothetical protein n=1 Tax=Kitasatospora sp. NBC_00374 TaxID=2975964 RepID=UPI0030DF3C8D